MTGAAEIRVAAGRSSEMFIADVCELRDGWLHVEGRWRKRTGANYTAIRWSEQKKYSWPAAEVVEVRWAVAS